MNSNTPYRGLLESSSYPSMSDKEKEKEKENFEAFKQKKYKQIDQARGKSQSKQQITNNQFRESHDQKRRSILKPMLNLRNLSLPVEQGPPTFDSEYEFRNLLISEPPSDNFRQQEGNAQYNIALNSITKQYEIKLKTQSQRYQLEITRLNKVIQTLKQQSKAIEPKLSLKSETEYCNLCSNGEVVSRLNKIMKSLEDAHKNCVTNQTQACKKIFNLERTLQQHKQTINTLVKDKNILIAKIDAFESQIGGLKSKLEIEKRIATESQNQSFNALQKQKINLRAVGMGGYDRSAFQQPKVRPSSISLAQPALSKRTSSSGFLDDFKMKKTNNVMDQYQSQLSAAQIIDRVKANSMLGSSINPRTRIINQKKFNNNL